MANIKITATNANTYDVVVIGAGVFGAWTALHLSRRGQRVLLVDAYGPANARASSGGESRIIRMGYGADELYTLWSIRSLAQWKQLFAATFPTLFQETGVLWLAKGKDQQLANTISALERCRVPFTVFNRSALAKRFPQFALHNIDAGILETGSGVLMARRAVATVVEEAIKLGVEYRPAQIVEPVHARQKAKISGSLPSITTAAGDQISARHFVFACGAWLGKLFPKILASRIFPTRQEVFFFGPPPGDTSFAPPSLPTWLIQGDETYGMPDLETRGFKIAFDYHGERVDPDTQSRVVSQKSIHRMRQYVAKRFPNLRNSPIVETRICQYENTSSGDFLVDRHPQFENVWFAGGGSGHGFKHGPAIGEYVASQLLEDAPAEPRFLLATKEKKQKRAIY